MIGLWLPILSWATLASADAGPTGTDASALSRFETVLVQAPCGDLKCPSPQLVSLPPVEMVLTGQKCDDQQCTPLRFHWSLSGCHLEGTVQFGDQLSLRMVDANVSNVVVEPEPNDAMAKVMTHVRYKVRYSVDLCENVPPEADGVIRWSRCLYHRGETKPQWLTRSGELTLTRQCLHTDEGCHDSFVVAGQADDTPSAVMMARGSGRPPKFDPRPK